ncbi:MAG: metallophosphoesterase [Pseudomonadota bacterium]
MAGGRGSGVEDHAAGLMAARRAAAPQRSGPPTRIYAIGDVHGHLDKLREVHRSIEEDLRATPAAGPHAILHIGDYVDRGPDSRGVIQFLIDGLAAKAPWICLLGNHDRMMHAFLAARGGRDPRASGKYFWLHPRLGGLATLRSYGVDAPDDVSEADASGYHEAFRAAVPEPHRGFLESLRSRFVWGDWYFAHAGVAPGVPLSAQVEDDLIWIRGEFLESKLDYGATIVHGHTPVVDVEDHGNRIAIDTGAAYGGPLACVAFEGKTARVLGGRRLR